MDERRISDELDDLASPSSLVWALVGAVVGAVLAVVLLPHVLPAVLASTTGPAPKAWWHLSRASGFVAFVLLGISMTLGLLLSSHEARRWPGASSAFVLHQHASLLGLGFSVFHALVLLGDRFADLSLSEIVVPFASRFRPVAVGLGQIGLVTMTVVAVSFHLRRRIGTRAFRIVHLASFGVFALALLHGLLAGTDRDPFALVMYAVPSAAVLFFTVSRVLLARCQDAPGREAGKRRSSRKNADSSARPATDAFR